MVKAWRAWPAQLTGLIMGSCLAAKILFGIVPESLERECGVGYLLGMRHEEAHMGKQVKLSVPMRRALLAASDAGSYGMNIPTQGGVYRNGYTWSTLCALQARGLTGAKGCRHRVCDSDCASPTLLTSAGCWERDTVMEEVLCQLTDSAARFLLNVGNASKRHRRHMFVPALSRDELKALGLVADSGRASYLNRAGIAVAVELASAAD